MESGKQSNRNELPSLSTSLLDQVQQMQPDAWARLVEVFNPIVYRWARTAGLPGADAADVVQEVFVAVARNISRFERQKEKGSFRSWLATITRNRVRDCLKKRARHPRGFGGTQALKQLNNVQAEDAASGQGDSIANLEDSISLATLDQRLPIRLLEIVRSECNEKTWEAFWQTTVKGRAAADVAALLEIPVGNVYQAKSRILNRLRKRMEELP